MERSQIKYDIPDEWLKNKEKGLCPVCAKTKDEFEKNQRTYCSKKCADKYRSKIYVWQDIRNEFLRDNGKICAMCGITEKKGNLLRKKKFEEAIEEWKNKGGVKKIKKQILKVIAELESLFNDEKKILNKPYFHFHLDSEGYPNEWDFSKYEPSFEVDHIIAVVNGGDMFDKNNLQVLCNECHRKKTKKDMKKRVKGNKKLNSK